MPLSSGGFDEIRKKYSRMTKFGYRFKRMETLIKVQPDELNVELLNKIKEFIREKDVDITITLTEFDPAYQQSLNKSINQSKEKDQLITLSMEEFIAYTPLKGK
jgi:uncharacterized Fe-S cluster-containing MiaB family protein